MTTEAQIAYDKAQAETIAQLEALLAKAKANVERPHWGHVGTLNKVNSDLAEIRRFIGA